MENVNEKKSQKSHILNLYNREKLEVSGVSEVISSTEKEVISKIANSIMVIVGSELRIVKLIPEEELLTVAGKIDCIKYENKINKKSFISKVFK